jgi:uncharacterized damage-inducible protein DinB
MTPEAIPPAARKPAPDPVPDLRFPIARFSPTHRLAQAPRADQIDTLRQLPQRLRGAVDGLSDSQLDTPYRDGGWTVRQLVHHIFDSHANAYIRFKLALTEDAPTIKPYDEAAWARLPDSRLPITVSLPIIEGLHLRWVALVESLTAADYARVFHHPERGPQDLATTLALYAWHSQHHTAHITALRQRMGW